MDLDCDIGYLHSGMEKMPDRQYTMIAPYWDRLDYIAAVSNGLVWRSKQLSRYESAGAAARALPTHNSD